MSVPNGTVQNSSAPAEYAEAVTPSDTVALTNVARCLYIGTSGHVAAVLPDDSVVTFKNVPVGFMPVRVKRVNATGTTATDLVALY